jgi:hypothetical protein
MTAEITRTINNLRKYRDALITIRCLHAPIPSPPVTRIVASLDHEIEELVYDLKRLKNTIKAEEAE